MPHACHRFWKCYKTFTFRSFLTTCTIPCACHAKQHLLVQKCSEYLRIVFCTFDIEMVLRATTACTVSTSQLPKVVRTWCFVHFDFKMCFAPPTARTFSTSQLQKVVRTWCFVHFDFEMHFAPQRRANFSSLICPAGSAPAALASLLFDPPEPQIIEKTHFLANFLPFRAAGPSFF